MSVVTCSFCVFAKAITNVTSIEFLCLVYTIGLELRETLSLSVGGRRSKRVGK